MDTYTVGELASMAGITVRTLHHYDEIGLLRPTGRTPSGYRVYDDDGVERLRAILTYRELGLGLDEVATAIDDTTTTLSTLSDARGRVLTKISHLEAIAANLTRAIEGTAQGDTMTAEEKLSVFGDFDPAEHEAEARDRWGGSSEHADSIQRTATYTKSDWDTINAEVAEIYAGLLALRDAGIGPDSPQAHDLVTEHRAHISRWYYACTPHLHAGLGQMYTGDPRFTKNIDRFGEGLAEYLSAAIAAAYP